MKVNNNLATMATILCLIMLCNTLCSNEFVVMGTGDSILCVHNTTVRERFIVVFCVIASISFSCFSSSLPSPCPSLHLYLLLILLLFISTFSSSSSVSILLPTPHPYPHQLFFLLRLLSSSVVRVVG